MAKPRNEVASVTYLAEGMEPSREPVAKATAIRWTFSDKEVVEVKVAEIPAAVLDCAALFGIKTKFRNSYCDADNLPAAKAALRKQLATAKAGDWNAPERDAALLSYLPAAIMEVRGVSREAADGILAELRSKLDAASFKARCTAIASDPAIAQAIAKLRAGAPQDLDALFSA